jgi:hypothetical protein
MKNNIATLTLPLHVNYGAMLQAYALHKAIEDLGYTPLLLDIRPSLYKKNILLSFGSYLKNLLKRIKKCEPEYGNFEFERFAKSYLNKTKKIRFNYQFRNHLDYFGYVVGSDQVWRAEYALNIGMFFFDFLPDECRRVSYAASFGKSSWSYTPEQTEKCLLELKKFQAISVRENSAVELVKDKLNCSSEHVLDPTMIVPIDTYHDLIKKNATSNFNKSDMFSYVLDMNDEKKSVISSMSIELGLTEKICNEGLSDYNKMSIEDWLQGIRDCGFVITDSFHGMVFCILFRKEFLILANNNRGYERFDSLLTELGIPERLINENELKTFQSCAIQPINYEMVNVKLSLSIDKSITFLKNAIS